MNHKVGSKGERKPSREEFDAFFRQEEPGLVLSLTKEAKRRHLNREDAEDALQIACMEILKQPLRCMTPAYVYVAARRELEAMCRKKKADRAFVTDRHASVHEPLGLSSVNNEDLMDSQAIQQLTALAADLPLMQRLMYQFRFKLDMPDRVVAELLAKPDGTVRSNVSATRKAMETKARSTRETAKESLPLRESPWEALVKHFGGDPDRLWDALGRPPLWAARPTAEWDVDDRVLQMEKLESQGSTIHIGLVKLFENALASHELSLGQLPAPSHRCYSEFLRSLCILRDVLPKATALTPSEKEFMAPHRLRQALQPLARALCQELRAGIERLDPVDPETVAEFFGSLNLMCDLTENFPAEGIPVLEASLEQLLRWSTQADAVPVNTLFLYGSTLCNLRLLQDKNIDIARLRDLVKRAAKEVSFIFSDIVSDNLDDHDQKFRTEASGIEEQSENREGWREGMEALEMFGWGNR